MTTDLEIIQEIEKIINKKLTIEAYSEMMSKPMSYSLDRQKNLIALTLRHYCITEIPKIISDFSKIEFLDLSWNSLATELTPISTLVTLRTLFLSFNKFTDFTAVQNLTNLQHLTIANNINLKNLSVLKKMVNLQKLNVEKCKITDINGIKDCKKLQNLSIADNKIDDFSVLTGLPNLQVLDIKNNTSKDSFFVTHMPELRQLTISLSQISDTKHLFPLIDRRGILTINNNIQITSFKDLEDYKNGKKSITPILPVEEKK